MVTVVSVNDPYERFLWKMLLTTMKRGTCPRFTVIYDESIADLSRLGNRAYIEPEDVEHFTKRPVFLSRHCIFLCIIMLWLLVIM